MAEALPDGEVGDERAGLRWWKELLLAVGVYFVYSLVRNQFGSASGDPGPAYGHAVDIIDIERRLKNPPDGAHKITPYRVAYPTPRDTCTWDCDFFLVCPLFDDGSRVEDMIDRYYVKGDPLSYYTTEKLPAKE